MKNSIIKNLLLVGAFAAFSTSCSNDYLDINENPNAVHAENITPQLMLPGAMAQAYRTQAGPMNQFGNLMMNSWGGNSYVIGGPFAREFNLGSVDNTFYGGIWTGLYPRIANFAQIERYPNADRKQDNYVAIAKIMKAFYMQYIVDLYGDAPYSEAFLGVQNMAPKYDNDADIYRNLINGINEAKTLIDQQKGEEVGAADVIFGGNMDDWTRFANTIKMRMLMRMHKVTGEMATFRDAQIATLPSPTAQVGYITKDVIINPGYNATNDDSMNPYGLTWNRNSSGQLVSNYTVVTVSEHMANALEGNDVLADPNFTKFNALKDPRRSRLWTLIANAPTASGGTATMVKGVRQGATPGQAGAPTSNTNVSKFGLGNFVGATSVSTAAQVVAANNNRGGMVMLKAESLLLQAEASLRWPNFTNGQAAFVEAIQSHAAWVGGNATQINSYIAAANLRPGLGWTGTDAQKIEAIMTQKWIIMTNITPTEMFIEYNRMNQQYPYTPMATTAQRPNKPWRLVYPVSEFAANGANVPNITSDMVFTKNQWTPFWNQN